jgi:KaiC domain protein
MSEDEEDWFERALRESDEAAEPATAESDAESGDWFDEATGGADVDGDFGGVDAAGGTGTVDGGGSAEEDLFGSDFASAFENAPFPGGDEGAGEVDAPSGGFAEQEYDSDIPRIDLGISGLDEMIQGGIPRRSLMVAIGEAGTGKTTFGLQFINEALEDGESAVFIALEETHERVVDTAEDKGWPFTDYIDEGRLAVVDLDPIEMANSLTSIRDELPGLVREFGANRLVLDSVSLLEMMYSDQASRRNEIFDFTNSLKQAGVTTFLTSEASESDPYHSRFGIIEYLTDAVFVLRYIRPEDFRETRLAVEIQKIRDANHSRELKPYEITNEGISVYRQANIF